MSATMEFAERGADVSADGLHRYSLWRHWDPSKKRRATWVMLNPSTADAMQDDPTIRKCIGFTKRLTGDFGGIVVVNLFAYRATEPRELVMARNAGADIVGVRNDSEIRRVVLTNPTPEDEVGK